MELDPTTMIAVTAIVSVATGLFLAYTGWQYRTTSAAGIWGLGNVVASAGLAIFAIGTYLDEAFALILAASGLFWISIARFHQARMPFPFLAAAALAWAAVSFLPLGMSEAVALGAHQIVIVPVLAGAVWQLWRGRHERLPARWPLLGLLAVHTAVVLGSGMLELAGVSLNTPDTDGLLIAVVAETLVFIIGTTVFVVTMIRERGIADERAAAQLDNLSGLLNRGAFMEAAMTSLASAGARPVAAILFDLDSFKRINDTYGHPTGDTVIRTFARTLKRSLRRGDIGGRIGGEEFAVLLPGAGPEAGIVIAERIRIAFAEDARWIEGQPLNATVSAGVALAVPDAPLDRLLREADRALYLAKTAGRNRVQFAYGAEIDPDPVVLRIA